MSRHLRILFPGAVYNVGARGNERNFIFKNDSDRQRLLDIFHKAIKKFNVTLHAYAIMGNHYHILIETQDPNLSSVMHFINMRYATYFNLRNDRKGHVFERRFTAWVTQRGDAMKRAVQYMHMNPMRAKMEKKLFEYKWTSHGKYIGIDKNSPADCGYVLSLFGEDTRTAIPAYEKYMTKARKFNKVRVETEIYGKAIIGDDSFTKQIKLMIRNKKLPDEIACRKELRKIYQPSEVINGVSSFYGISSRVLCGRHGSWNKHKKTLIYLLVEDCGLYGAETARFLEIHQSAVSKAIARIEKDLYNNTKLKEDIMRIRTKYITKIETLVN